MTTAQTAPGRHLFDGTVRLFLAEALAFPTGVITAAFLTRSLHPAGYGLFTLAAVLISWLEWMVPALFSRAAVKFVSDATNWRDVSSAVLRLYLGSGAALGAVVWILAGWIARVLGEPSLADYLRLYTIEIPIFAASYAHRNILVGRGEYRSQSIVSASRWIGRMALIIILVASGFSVRGAILGSIGGVLVELAAGRWFVRPSLFGRGAVSIRSICKFAVPLFAAAVGTRLFERMDIFALKSMGGSAAQAGFYGAAQNIALAPNLFALSFTPLLLGTLTRLLREGDRNKAVEIGRNAIRAVLCLAPFAAVAFGASGELVRTVFGEAFASTAPLVGPLVTAALLMVLSAAGSAMVIAAGKPAWTLYSTVPLPFLGVAGLLFAIPRFGAVGASYVTLTAALCGAALSLYQVHRLWGIYPARSSLLRSLVVSAAAWWIAFAWHTGTALLVIKLALLAIVIVGGFVLTGEFSLRGRESSVQSGIYAGFFRRLKQQAGGGLLRRREWQPGLIVFVILFAIAVGLQWRTGAFQAEFNGYPDESGHFVTALMIRDYVAAGFPASPMAYARDYFLHYPRVQIGHWPPLFHALLAGWMLLFSVHKMSAMLFLALLAALTAYAIYRALGSKTGICLGIVFLFLPLVQDYTSRIMAEMLIALLCVCAALAYARYMSAPSRQAAWLFSCLAMGAILTKANGWLLALLPPLSILLTRRFDLLRRGSFWLPLIIVIPPCAAWYGLTFRWVEHGWSGTTDAGYLARHVFLFNATETWRMVGTVMLGAAFLGLWAKVLRPFRQSKAAPEWASLGALWIAVLVFHSFIAPVQEDRHMIASAPAILIFAGEGFRFLASKAVWPVYWRVAAVLVLLGLFGAETLRFHKKPSNGISELARILCEQDHGAAFLVESDEGGGEGALVAEVALRDARPDHFVIRRTKWIRSGGDLLTELETLPVRVVVVESHSGRTALESAVAADPGSAELFWSRGEIRAYRLLRASALPAGKFRLDLGDSFGGILER